MQKKNNNNSCSIERIQLKRMKMFKILSSEKKIACDVTKQNPFC